MPGIIGLPPPGIALGTGRSDQTILGTGTSVPIGIESVLEYNGLFLNNRSWLDTYVVTGIDGLADADIRDDREVNPSDDGETPFDSWYSGRTLIMRGYIRAFEIHKLRDMQQALRQAFGDIKTEYPLIFYALDPINNSMIECKKNAPLAWGDEQTRDNMASRDFMITLRASKPFFTSVFTELYTKSLGVVDTFVEDTIAAGLYTFATGAGTLSVSSGKLAPSSTSRKRFYRNNLGIDYSDAEVTIKYEPDATFTSSEINLIGRYLNDTNYVYARVDAAGDLRIRKIDEGSDSNLGPTSENVSGRAGGSSYWMRLRLDGNVLTVEHATSDPRISGAGITDTVTHTLVGADETKFGVGIRGKLGIDVVPGSTSWRYDDPSFTAYKLDGEEIFEAINNGNYKAKPDLVLAGMTAPILNNGVNGEQLQIIPGTVISHTNPFMISIAEGEMTDSSVPAVNKFSKLAVASDWMTYEPGPNSIGLTAEGLGPFFSGGWIVPYVSSIHHHTWN